jgi:hypothetical protein
LTNSGNTEPALRPLALTIKTRIAVLSTKPTGIGGTNIS